jgi:UDP-glucose 4-epimerase
MALDPNIVYETINIGPDEETTSILTLANMVAEELNFPLPPIHMADRPREVKHATCSSDKARHLLGYKTTTDLKTAIRETANYIKQQGAKEFDYSYPVEIISEKTPKTWSERLM